MATLAFFRTMAPPIIIAKAMVVLRLILQVCQVKLLIYFELFTGNHIDENFCNIISTMLTILWLDKQHYHHKRYKSLHFFSFLRTVEGSIHTIRRNEDPES